jgi:hypothetical protein
MQQLKLYVINGTIFIMAKKTMQKKFTSRGVYVGPSTKFLNFGMTGVIQAGELMGHPNRLLFKADSCQSELFLYVSRANLFIAR